VKVSYQRESVWVLLVVDKRILIIRSKSLFFSVLVKFEVNTNKVLCHLHQLWLFSQINKFVSFNYKKCELRLKIHSFFLWFTTLGLEELKYVFSDALCLVEYNNRSLRIGSHQASKGSNFHFIRAITLTQIVFWVCLRVHFWR
jgi:hypothetical protein